ncbi:MAG: hypothetical protein ACE37K_22810 [Planctomycetota bacterium]
MGEANVGLAFDAGEVEARVVLVAGDAVAVAAAVGIDQRADPVLEAHGAHVAGGVGGRIVERIVAARHEHGLDDLAVRVDGPPLADRVDAFDAGANVAQVGQQVVADELHVLVDDLAGAVRVRRGEPTQQRAVDRRVQL